MTLQATRYIAIVNQKGGVGKTTTAVNLATALSAMGQKVCLIDFDAQGNASTGLGVRRSELKSSSYDLLFSDQGLEDLAMQTKIPNLDIVPSSIHLSGAEIELVDKDNREYVLRNKIQGNGRYDYIIMDCPPSLTLLTLNVLVAVQSLIVPLQCEFFALEGLSHLTKTIQRVRTLYNPGLTIQGVVLTMYDRRNNLSAQVEKDVRDH